MCFARPIRSQAVWPGIFALTCCLQHLLQTPGRLLERDLSAFAGRRSMLPSSSTRAVRRKVAKSAPTRWQQNRMPAQSAWESAEGPLVKLDDADYILLFRTELEEQHRQSILRRKPRFLPFKECMKWVQAMGLWDTQEDWQQWIESGEKRNPYIPSRPDEYYGNLGQWQGWRFFLHGASRDVDEPDTVPWQ